MFQNFYFRRYHFFRAQTTLLYLGLFSFSNIMASETLKKTSSTSAGQEISHFLRKPQIRHRVHKRKSLVPMASQAKTGQYITRSSSNFCLISGCYLYLALPSGPFSLTCTTQILCSFSQPPVRDLSTPCITVVHSVEYK